jgi:hypothetical protein
VRNPATNRGKSQVAGGNPKRPRAKGEFYPFEQRVEPRGVAWLGQVFIESGLEDAWNFSSESSPPVAGTIATISKSWRSG